MIVGYTSFNPVFIMKTSIIQNAQETRGFKVNLDDIQEIISLLLYNLISNISYTTRSYIKNIPT